MPPTKAKKASKPKPDEVADSWEDASLSSDSDTAAGDDDTTASNTEAESELQPLPSNESPTVPPPTPSSPTSHSFPYSHPTIPQASPRSDPAFAALDRGGSARDARRPDKSAATASRLIAGALGVRPPKMTPEQREYENAVRDKERRRREAERERVREDERMKAAVWEE